MKRSYFGSSIAEFIKIDDKEILGSLLGQHGHQTLEVSQKNAWLRQIAILKQQLYGLNGYVYFEFSIPRMGKRVDNIVILGSRIFLLEFKIGAKDYDKYAIDQVIDYALDLRNFHEGSHHACLIPILVAEEAKNVENDVESAINLRQGVRLNANNLGDFLQKFNDDELMDVDSWESSRYKPTPTIIEAAQALYQQHDVAEITRSDAGAENLSITAQTIDEIIAKAKLYKQKSICFVTGVPGAGKTLAGLNIANQRLQVAEEEHAVFLSGNGPLVAVLQEALARNTQGKSKGNALKEAKAFIQNIHHFRDEYLKNEQAPLEKVVVFDEAQRAWDEHQTSKFMRQKRGIAEFNSSESEFLIEVMDRHTDWCVIICLIGGGQEINTGEAGIEAWISALNKRFLDWHIHYSDLIVDEAGYLRDGSLKEWLKNKGNARKRLHLATSVRSFRSEKVSALIHALLNTKAEAAQLYQKVYSQYPIVLTRDLQTAKSWLKQQAKGSERYGLVASSGARRLKALGVNVKTKIDVAHWFLNAKDDVRSSYFLEDVATEFDVQGLELDWVCMAWGENFYHCNNGWVYQSFKGNKWQKIHKLLDQQYTQNSYRVLLTRARQGLVIWIPEGSKGGDITRHSKFYDGTYQYLKSLGIKEL